jgi:uncharacterized membrane protein
VPLYCSDSGVINCAAVESSAYSTIFGIPLSYGILVWFIVAIALLLASQRHKRVSMPGSAWNVLGAGGAAYSLISMLALAEICEYCIILDGILIAICVITLHGMD